MGRFPQMMDRGSIRLLLIKKNKKKSLTGFVSTTRQLLISDVSNTW